MKKMDFIEQFGEEAYERRLEQRRALYNAHFETENARTKKWDEEHPEEKLAWQREQGRKGGRYYEKHLAYRQTGVQGERNKIRRKDRKQWYQYKQIIAPDSQIHHEWVPGTAEYKGVALVEKDQHMHGFIDVIQILDGKITLFTEAQINA